VTGAQPAARQVAALPLRRDAATGGCEVLLVTTLSTRRWIIPKGWPWPERADAEAAAREAFEEAGVRGDIAPDPIGTFTYLKRRKKGDDRTVVVCVYLLRVTEELTDWPERLQRDRRWMSPREAAERVEEPELKALLLSSATT